MARVKGIVASGLSAGRTAEQLAAQTSEAQSRAAAVASRVQERTRRRIETDTAGLPPDWLPTTAAGAGMGMVFGPVGALIGAGVAGILSKRRREGIAAYASQEVESTSGSLERAGAALDDTLAQATNDQERAEIKMLRQEFDTWSELANASPDPGTRGAALVKALEVAGTMDAELEEWQGERLAAQKVEREQFGVEVGQFNTLQDDLRGVSADYLGKRENWNTIRTLAQEQNVANDIGLVYSVLKMYDPQSTVMPGEQAQISGAGGIGDMVAATYNRLITGEGTLSPEVRADFIKQAGQLYQASLKQQKGIESEFRETARATGLRDELVARVGFTLPDEGATFAQEIGAAPVPGLNTSDERPAAAVGEGSATPAAQGPSRVPEGSGTRFATDLLKETVEFGEGIGRLARGETLIESEGRYFVQGEDGEVLREVNRPNEMFPSPAPIFERFQRFMGPEGNAERMRRDAERRRESPGLFQEGGFFDRRRQRPTNE